MAVQCVGGKPGGGKTLLATKIIIDELRNSSRYIITNVSLKLDRIAEYFRKNGWSWEHEGVTDVWLRNRIIILEEEQLSEFYRYRFPGCTPLPMTKNTHGIPEHADYNGLKKLGDYRPCLYVLDEVHIAFNSRRWQDTGPGVMYYLSQHRKLGDDVVLISQSLQNVDKQMRSVAQDCTYVRNLAKETHGIFRLPSVFVKRVFLETPPGPNTKAVQTGTFRLHVEGLASLYDTAAGVGIVGGTGADTKEKKKGIHWMWYVGTIVFVIWWIFNYVPKIVARQFEYHPPASKEIPKPSQTNSPSVVAELQLASVRPNVSTNIITGMAYFNKTFIFTMASGGVYKTADPEFIPGFVGINGRYYPLREDLR